MKEIITKEELKEFENLKGEVRGIGLKTYPEFILKEEGTEGFNRLKDKMAEIGGSVTIESMKFYPIRLWLLLILVIKRLFNYDDRKIQEMGEFQVKASLLVKLFMNYFVSIEKAAEALPRIWREHFTVGDFNTSELNKKKKFLILKLENFNYNPIQCQLILGVLRMSVQMIVKKDVFCEETKCVFRGDPYHEFLLKW